MNHQPFEKWIFDEDDLEPKELNLLADHLDDCPDCASLQSSLHQVERQMRLTSMATPAAGFAERWKASLAERQAREQQRQVRKFLITLFAAGGFLMLLIIGQLLFTSSPTDWLIAGMEIVTVSIERLSRLQQLTINLLQVLPPAIPLAVWVFVSVTFSLLGILWAGTIWRLSTQGVLNK
jgi:hypothetical protein